MNNTLNFYINGEWVSPLAETQQLDVINPATEQAIAKVAIASASDVDRAVNAAHAAFAEFSQTSIDDRIALLEALAAAYKSRLPQVGEAIQRTMGAPDMLAVKAQAASGYGHLMATIATLKEFSFEHMIGSTKVLKEPIGVCGLITPWNWPANQIGCKVGPALAAGCTMVLKPSEQTPIDAVYWAEAMHDAGVPAGVFNLIQGDGATTGVAMSTHPKIDMMSFTGSTRAGVHVSKSSADTVKRVALELGGKSPNIILEDADLPKMIANGVKGCFLNSGQSCDAPTRMLVPREMQEEIGELAVATAEKLKVGDPNGERVFMGPLSSERQFRKVQDLIRSGIDEGATVLTGGVGKPDDLDVGYYCKPTIFADVRNDMRIAQEEIFGPVLAILPYDSEAHAIEMANDTPYGLSSYVSSSDPDRAQRIARQLRAGMVHINGAGLENLAPFGGYKQSGNGREWGAYGLEEFLEVKAVMG